MPRRKVTITRALSRRSPRGAETDATAQEARVPRLRIGCGCALLLLLLADLILRAIVNLFTLAFNSYLPMRALVINLSTVDADAVFAGVQTAILRRCMPSGCKPGMRIIFHFGGVVLGEAIITAACIDTAENIATRFAGPAWQTIADAAEYLDGARLPGALLVEKSLRYEPARPWRGMQPLGHLYI